MQLSTVTERLFGHSGLRLGLDIFSLDNETFVDLAYKFILGRRADRGGRKHFKDKLDAKTLNKNDLLKVLIDSAEFSSTRMFTQLGTSLHYSRIQFIRQLPAAKNIVDLGGSCQESDDGAMVGMGYPYNFDKLTIIDLPFNQRHEIYRNGSGVKSVKTSKGQVEYLYQSMTDMSPVQDQSIDLVYSGQSIEHVTVADAKKVYSEALRVLRPGGIFALDTPNGRITRIQQDEFVDPDHKVEYTSQQLQEGLRSAGFEIVEAKGLNYAGEIIERDQFDQKEIARNSGIFSDASNCYLLAFICRKPL